MVPLRKHGMVTIQRQVQLIGFDPIFLFLSN